MELIQLPNSPVIQQTGPFAYTLVLEPLHPGYGVTVGNALRRVLLSSMPGAAVTAVKIKFVDHEFSTIPHIKEDAVQLILNIKQLVVKSSSPAPVKLRLNVKREGEVTAADIQETDQVEIVNKDLHLATIDSPKGELDIELTVGVGRGYVPTEAREDEKMELGTLAVDAIYTPVRAAYFEISHVRLGQMTNFDRLTMTIETNGTLDGLEAFGAASRILTDHFSLLLTDVAAAANNTLTLGDSEENIEAGNVDPTVVGEVQANPSTVNDLDALPLSTRARNALVNSGYTSVETLKQLTAEDIENLPGLGKKTAAEIMLLLGKS